MTILNARNLSLQEVQRLFAFQEQYSDSFSNYLSLEAFTEAEQQELLQIRNDFDRYLTAGKVSEGQVKFLVVAPLLRLAGFYRYPIEFCVSPMTKIRCFCVISGSVKHLIIDLLQKSPNTPPPAPKSLRGGESLT